MKRRTQIKFKQLVVITCVWLTVGFMITVYDYLVLQANYSSESLLGYSFLFAMSVNMGAALTGAVLGGSFLVFFVNVKYQDKPYGYTILVVSISFILIIVLNSLIIGILMASIQTGKPLTDQISKIDIYNFVFNNSRAIKNTIVWSVVVGLTQLFLQMNSKFGYGVFWNIVRGKYNTPKSEHRTFMSLDLNSSTSIAETLGDEKYHQLLKDFFADITNPILDNEGEIYQYVGDEVIIAWKNGDQFVNNRSLNCFFDMKLQIEKNKEKYLHRYGIIPTFKAGIHWGKVIVGEVGIIKRDITYSGDVMNITSRIRNMCKEFEVELIASSELLDGLNFKNYSTKQIGDIKLRGKEKKVLLSALIPNPEENLIDFKR